VRIVSTLYDTVQTSDVADCRPRLLVLSHVPPVPRNSGQRQRVFYTLQAAREYFHVTFATAVPEANFSSARSAFAGLCDDVVLLPSRYPQARLLRGWRRVVGTARSASRGLKFSNYVIGDLEFSPDRVASMLDGRHFDCALFEYWHAAKSAAVFRAKGIPVVLDMHNVCWKSLERDLGATRGLPESWARWAVRKYRLQEEASWDLFDSVIAINKEEEAYVRSRTPGRVAVVYGPMGTDLENWPFGWAPADGMRVAFYGGLGSRHNQNDALRCVKEIMPRVWRSLPEAEIWLVGSNPPPHIRALAADRRVRVTGYVENVQETLKEMWAVVCPWSGRYGFRSRLVEVMALGVPAVASPEAVDGMELQHGDGLLLGRDDDELASHVLRLLQERSFAVDQSRRAREQVGRLYTLEKTYGSLMRQLRHWVSPRGVTP
jgi:glycosyltransferase involved in cell wall biosynthesis